MENKSNQPTKSRIKSINFYLPSANSLFYDANGNLTNDGLRSLAYDSENQLTNVTVANRFKKDFVFDGLHRLRIKREYTWNGSAWAQTNEVRYVWDGNNIVQLRDSNNVPTLTLTRGLDLSGSLQGAGGIGGLLAMTESSGANSYFHADALGNVTALMDAGENIVARRMFDAFGRTINLTGGKAGVNPFWHASQLHDEDLDLYSYLRRPYSPTLQRWPNHDPIGERGGINLYGYVGNDPVNQVDPLGLYLFYVHYFETYWSEISHGHFLRAPFVAAESVWSDVGTQGTTPDQAHIHAMGGKKSSPCGNGLETRDEAKAGTEKYIQDQLEQYKEAHKWWEPWSGASYLGNAYHATEDSYAKGHNYQPWQGSFPGWGHLFWDTIPSGSSFGGAYNMQPAP